MITTILIILYILNVFLNRWWNKILYKKYGEKPIPFFWFVPLYGTAIFFAINVVYYLHNKKLFRKSKNKFSNKINHFFGNYWIIILLIALTSCSTATTTKYVITDLSNNRNYYTNEYYRLGYVIKFKENKRNGKIVEYTLFYPFEIQITNKEK